MLTAVEALLVSLYGFWPVTDLQAEKQINHETILSPSSPLQTDALCLEKEGNEERDIIGTSNSDKALSTARPGAFLDRQSSNCSSSSSIADDWIVNQIPVELYSKVSLYDELAQNCTLATKTGPASKSPENLADNKVSAVGTCKDQISAEDWSRGTALSDPTTGEALQPIIIHQPSKHNDSDSDEVKSQSSSSKKMLNAITEKRAALTAFDMICNRAMRAPLSPAALFEKDVRAVVLREDPTASLQDISTAVNERWKNLGEEECKK